MSELQNQSFLERVVVGWSDDFSRILRPDTFYEERAYETCEGRIDLATDDKRAYIADLYFAGPVMLFAAPFTLFSAYKHLKNLEVDMIGTMLQSQNILTYVTTSLTEIVCAASVAFFVKNVLAYRSITRFINNHSLKQGDVEV